MSTPAQEGSTIPDDEDMFRFVTYNDYDEGENRIRSGLFFTRAEVVSMNRGSIWPLQKHREIVPAGLGICSVTAGEFRSASSVDLLPAPLDLDPLLNIPNPSHANASDFLSKGQAKRVAAAVSRNMHLLPKPKKDIGSVLDENEPSAASSEQRSINYGKAEDKTEL